MTVMTATAEQLDRVFQRICGLSGEEMSAARRTVERNRLAAAYLLGVGDALRGTIYFRFFQQGNFTVATVEGLPHVLGVAKYNTRDPKYNSETGRLVALNHLLTVRVDELG